MLVYKYIPALIVVVFAATTVSAQSLSVRDLRCNDAVQPKGVESPAPRFNWKLSSGQNNVMQTAFRIIVADNPGLLAKAQGNVWDSGKRASDSSIQVRYQGPPLIAARTYYWKVMIWDNHNNSASSAVSSWQMGLLTSTDWSTAKWIGHALMPDSLRRGPESAEQKRTALSDILPLMRKKFQVNTNIKRATVFISGLGHFDLYLNGKKVGDHFLDPGWTNYDKEALYTCFDVTTQLKKGVNAIGVMLGNGFYFAPSGRYLKLQTAYGYPKMICRLMLEYSNGSSQDVVSDETWKTAAGPVTFSSIYGGEDYDATKEQAAWSMASFSDKQWAEAKLIPGKPLLGSQKAMPLKVLDTFLTKRITQPKPGVWVYDLGQNASGIPRITVRGKRGDTVRLWPSELLNTDGTITTKPIGTPVYFTYVLKGNEAEAWQPQFMYYGFRYVQVEGAVPRSEKAMKQQPVVLDLIGLHTRNAAERAGEFECSNEMFNKTDRLIDWAIRSNMASVLTDCPHREKLGWLEEAHLVGPSIRYNYNIATLCRKVIHDMMAAQTEQGLVPSTAPEYARFGGPFRDSPEWGSNCIVMPWYVYEWYGDLEVLEEAYPMMQRYLNYLKSKSNNHILMHGLGDWYDIGPKEPGPSQLTPQGLTATSYYYYDAVLMSKIAGLLNKSEDSVSYAALAISIRSAFNGKYFKEDKLSYGSGSQTSNAMPVYMDLVDSTYRTAVVNNIVAELKASRNSLTAGDIGFRYLLRVLDNAGRSDVIYDMNSNASVPGYGYQLMKGATALTESWQAYDNASNNHMMLGHIKEWFFSGLAGIRPVENAPAFKKIEIRPQPVGDVTWAKGSYNSPYGLIKTDWKKNGDAFALAVSIPPNTTATVYLPAKENQQLTNGTQPMRTKSKDGQISVQIGSGNYQFQVR